MPLKTSSSVTKLRLVRPRSDGTSPRYRYRNAIWNASAGIDDANFQSVVSGAAASFLLKYGDLADSTNLCRFHCSVPAVRQISDVLGVFRVNKEVMCEARGCKGSVLLL